MINELSARGWTASARSTLALPTWPLGFFAFWDFYFDGVRPFDQLGALFLFLCLFFQRDAKVDAINVWKIWAIGVFFVWTMVLGGFLHDDALKPAIGIAEGIFVALCVASSRWNAKDIIQLLRVLITIHAAALFFQAFIYFTLHYSLNYQAWIGAELRTDTGLGMRPAGLFLEPAHYCLIMFSLLCLFRIIGGQSARLEGSALISMLLSISLWGWGAAVFYILLFRPRIALAIFPFVLGLGSYAAIAINASDFNKNIITFNILRRILDPTNDGSTQSRYSAYFSLDPNAPTLWFGRGITASYEAYGANGLSYLLSTGGLFGTAIVFGLWILAMPTGRRLRGFLSLVFMLSAATQWTFIWWWVWLAIAACTDNETAEAVGRTISDKKMGVRSSHVNAPAGN